MQVYERTVPLKVYILGMLMPADDEFETTIGKRIRAARLERRMSLTALATALGVTYQQVAKYESGRNRISASMLHRVAGLLDVEMTYFFADDSGQEFPRRTPTDATPPSETELAAVFSRIDDDRVRQRVIELVAALGRIDRRK